MKFEVSFKDPDTLHDAIYDAVYDEVCALGVSDEERDALVEIRCAKVQKDVGKWFAYGEYVDLLVDTDADTVTVIKRN